MSVGSSDTDECEVSAICSTGHPAAVSSPDEARATRSLSSSLPPDAKHWVHISPPSQSSSPTSTGESGTTAFHFHQLSRISSEVRWWNLSEPSEPMTGSNLISGPSSKSPMSETRERTVARS